MRTWIGAIFALAAWSLPAHAQDIGVADAVAITVADAAETHAAEQRAADQTIRGLRRNVDRLAAEEEVGRTALAELTSARGRLVAQLAARDADYARFVASFREQVEAISSTAEGRALLAQRRPGNLAAVRARMREMVEARNAAIARSANAARAANTRGLAVIALDDRARGEATTEEVIALYAAVTRLDPSVYWDWIEIGRLYREAGDLPAAQRAAERAVQTAGDERDRSEALNELGDMLVALEDLVSARARFEESLAIGQRLAAAEPSSAHLQRSVSMILIRLGEVLVSQGDLAGARARYDESLAIARRLAAVDPLQRLAVANLSPAGLQRDVGVSLAKIGDVLLYQGDRPGARARFEESLAIARGLAAGDPGSASLQRDVWVSMWRLQRFPESGVTWTAVAATMEDMDRRGVLARTDRKWLEQARANAAQERAAPLSTARVNRVLLQPLEGQPL